MIFNNFLLTFRNSYTIALNMRIVKEQSDAVLSMPNQSDPVVSCGDAALFFQRAGQAMA